MDKIIILDVKVFSGYNILTRKYTIMLKKLTNLAGQGKEIIMHVKVLSRLQVLTTKHRILLKKVKNLAGQGKAMSEVRPKSSK